MIPFENDQIKVVIPLTEQASVQYGKHTEWCTSALDDNRFNEYFYADQTVIIYILIKKTNKKYAVTYTSDNFSFEFLNANDHKISATDFYEATHILTTDLQKWVDEYDFQAIREKYIHQLSEGEKIDLLSIKPHLISKFPNASQKLQFVAVSQHKSLIHYIKNPTEEIQKYVVTADPTLIKYLKNPSEDVQLLAIRKNPYNLAYIKNPTEFVLYKAISEQPSLIQTIKNPPEELQYTAIKNDPSTIGLIDHPTEKIKKLAKSLSQFKINKTA